MKYKKEDIIDAIVKMRIEKGASTKTILDEFLMKQLGYKQSYSYLLLQEARKKIVEIYDVKNKELANEALGHLESMYEDAIKNKNIKIALEIRKEISKLTGLYAATKVDITSGNEPITTIKLIEIKSRDDLNGTND